MGTWFDVNGWLTLTPQANDELRAYLGEDWFNDPADGNLITVEQDRWSFAGAYIRLGYYLPKALAVLVSRFPTIEGDLEIRSDDDWTGEDDEYGDPVYDPPARRYELRGGQFFEDGQRVVPIAWPRNRAQAELILLSNDALELGRTQVNLIPWRASMSDHGMAERLILDPASNAGDSAPTDLYALIATLGPDGQAAIRRFLAADSQASALDITAPSPSISHEHLGALPEPGPRAV